MAGTQLLRPKMTNEIRAVRDVESAIRWVHPHNGSKRTPGLDRIYAAALREKLCEMLRILEVLHPSQFTASAYIIAQLLQGLGRDGVTLPILAQVRCFVLLFPAFLCSSSGLFRLCWCYLTANKRGYQTNFLKQATGQTWSPNTHAGLIF